MRVRIAAAITHQTARFNELLILKDCRNSMPNRKCSKLSAATDQKRVGTDYDPACPQFLDLRKNAIQLTVGACVQDSQLKPQPSGCLLGSTRERFGVGIFWIEE